MVDKDAWDQSALVGSTGSSLYSTQVQLGGLRSGWDQVDKGPRVPSGSWVGNSVDL